MLAQQLALNNALFGLLHQYFVSTLANSMMLQEMHSKLLYTAAAIELHVLAHTDRLLMVSIQTKEHVHVIPFTANSCSSHQPAFNKTIQTHYQQIAITQGIFLYSKFTIKKLLQIYCYSLFGITRALAIDLSRFSVAFAVVKK